MNSTVIGRNFTLGASVQYRCPTGSVTIGESSRACQSNGLWSKSAPSCKREYHFSYSPILVHRKANKEAETMLFRMVIIACGEVFHRALDDTLFRSTCPQRNFLPNSFGLNSQSRSLRYFYMYDVNGASAAAVLSKSCLRHKLRNILIRRCLNDI